MGMNPIEYRQIFSGAFAGAATGQQQSFVSQPKEDNIFAVGAKGAVDGGAASSGLGQTQRVSFENEGIVARLDAIDARNQAPEQRNSVLGKNLYILG